MKKIYQSNNGWAIHAQPDLMGEDCFSIYRYYPDGGWVPFKQVGNYLPDCFIWLRKGNFISPDELQHQLKMIGIL